VEAPTGDGTDPAAGEESADAGEKPDAQGRWPSAAIERLKKLKDQRNKARDAAPGLTFVPKRDCACHDKAQAAHNAFVSAGFEGTVFKSRGHYVTGSGDFSWKLKAWQDEDYEVVELIEGEGKHAASLGAVMCRAPNGETFKVGAFEFDDDERHAAWIGPRPTKAKVKFMTLTDRGAPHCGRVLALF